MKIKLFPLSIFFPFISYTENNPDTLTKEEINQTKSKIKAIVNKMVAYVEEDNIDSTMSYFQDIPDFVYVINGQSLSSSLLRKLKMSGR